MKRRIVRRITIALVGAVGAAAAWYAWERSTFSFGLPTAAQYSATVLPDLKGVVPWRTLADVDQRIDNGRPVAEFSHAILALDGKEIDLCGFMVPLDTTTAQRHFLLIAAPPSCPFCMPSGPEGTVEVLSRQPVEYSVQPVVMRGRFAAMKDEPNIILYKMTEAVQLAVTVQAAH